MVEVCEKAYGLFHGRNNCSEEWAELKGLCGSEIMSCKSRIFLTLHLFWCWRMKPRSGIFAWLGSWGTVCLSSMGLWRRVVALGVANWAKSSCWKEVNWKCGRLQLNATQGEQSDPMPGLCLPSIIETIQKKPDVSNKAITNWMGVFLHFPSCLCWSLWSLDPEALGKQIGITPESWAGRRSYRELI